MSPNEDRERQIVHGMLNSAVEQARSQAAEYVGAYSESLGDVDGSIQMAGDRIFEACSVLMNQEPQDISKQAFAQLAYVGLLSLLNEGTIELRKFPPEEAGP